MVAQTRNAESKTTATPGDAFSSLSPGEFDPHKQGGIRRLVVSLARLADIQGRLWLTEFKLTAVRVALYIALLGAAALIAILGIIFLFLGLFHVLTDLLHLRPVYAFLIFGMAQLLLASLLAIAANNQLRKRHRKPPRTAP